MSNYSPAMVARIQAAAPLNLDKAKSLSAEFGSVSYRSVISKAQSLGVPYDKQPARVAKGKADQPTKAAYLADIREALALPEREGDFTKAELAAIVVAIG